MKQIRGWIFVAFLCLLIGCGSRSVLDSASQAGTTPATGNFRLEVQLPQVNSQGSAGSLARLEVEIFAEDGSSVIILNQELESPNPPSVAVTVPGLTAPSTLRIVVRGFDSSDNKIADAEGFENLIAGDDVPVPLELTPISQTLSAIFTVFPAVALTPAAKQALLDEVGPQLEAAGYHFLGNRLVWPPALVPNWKVQVGNQTYRTDSHGRVRIPRPDSSVSEGNLIHPETPEVGGTFDISQLGSGQESATFLALGVPFNGGCGMDSSLEEEICGDIHVLDLNGAQARVLAQQIQAPALPTSGDTISDCAMTIPRPTEIAAFDRGSYPAPFVAKVFEGKLFFTYVRCHDICEKYNGFRTDTARNGSGESSYIGSTCWRYVRATCCLNEVPNADKEYNVAIAGIGVLDTLFGIGDFPSDSLWVAAERRSVAAVRPFVTPVRTVACLDNHKGRQCQQTKIADLSLDFRFSGKAELYKPSQRIPVIFVEPGEVVEFVVHNNGCFGYTTVSMFRKELSGKLEQTFKELAITGVPVSDPDSDEPNPKVDPDPIVRMQSSTDPVLTNRDAGGIHPLTAGTLTTQSGRSPADITPPRASYTNSPNRIFKDIVHFAIDPNVEANQEHCDRYRYFPDVALRYTAPSQYKPGQDTFVFDGDNCRQRVSFQMKPLGSEGTGDLGGSSTGTTTGGTTPVDLVSAGGDLTASHTVGLTECPQRVGSLAISRQGDEDVRIELSVASGASIFLEQPTAFTLGGSGIQATTRDVFFDCTTQASFSAIVTVTATRVRDGAREVVEVPVTVNISN